MSDLIYYFHYSDLRHGWWYSDRLSQLCGPYATKQEAAAALAEHQERVEVEGWGC